MANTEKENIRLFNAKELSKQVEKNPGWFRHNREDLQEIRKYLSIKRDEIINYLQNKVK